VAQGVARIADQMGEALGPEAAAPAQTGRHAPARLQQPGQPGAAAVFGEMDDQVVTPAAQGLQQSPFGPGLGQQALLFPIAVDQVQLRQGGMAFQHGCRIGVDQGVDLALGRLGLEHRKHGGSQQHVAVVAQLDDQGAANLGQGGGSDHGSHCARGEPVSPPPGQARYARPPAYAGTCS